MIRFKGNGRRVVIKRYKDIYKKLTSLVKDAKANNYHSLWGMGSGRPTDLHNIPGIDTDPNYYDYNIVDAERACGPCVVYAAKTDKGFDEFLKVIEDNFGSYKLYDGLKNFHFLGNNWWDPNDEDRTIKMFSKYITIDSVYDGVEFR